jgi:hypothetical protein
MDCAFCFTKDEERNNQHLVHEFIPVIKEKTMNCAQK